MRVRRKTKNKGVKYATYPCRKCSEPIKAGDEYYEWQHRHAPPSRQHASHGAPRQSELCTGKMSAVYAAVESIEDAVGNARRMNDISGLADALNNASSEVSQVKEEYEESLGNMPEQLQTSGTGEEIQNKIDELETFISELDDAATDCESFDGELTDMDADEPRTDHTDECPVTKVENGEAEEGDCDCGADEHDTWESEREEKISEACDRAEQAAESLSI